MIAAATPSRYRSESHYPVPFTRWWTYARQQESTVQDRAIEAAFCADRVKISTAKALASTDSCARASHVGIAKAYGRRLAAINGTEMTADEQPFGQY